MATKSGKPKKDSRPYKALASFADAKGSWDEFPEIGHVLFKNQHFFATDLFKALIIKSSLPEDEESFVHNSSPLFIPTDIFSKLSASDDALAVLDKWMKTTGYKNPDNLDVLKYPDCLTFSADMEERAPICFRCSKEEIKSVLKDCELTADGVLKFVMLDGQLHLSTESESLGKTTLPVTTCYTEDCVDDYEIHINFKYFKQAYALIPGDSLVMKFSFKHWVLKMHSEDNYVPNDDVVIFVALVNPDESVEEQPE